MNDGKMEVKEISSKTGLSITQVHNGLKDLKRRRLIIKEKITSDAEYNVPPQNKIKVSINNDVIPRIRSIIKNG